MGGELQFKRGCAQRSVKPIAGKKRGRPPKIVTEADGSCAQRARRTMARQLLWTDTGREEYNRTVERESDMCSEGECGVGQRFERGEGGGVT